MEWYLAVIRNYATFSGRARRKEYWMFYLINLIVYLVLNLLSMILGPLRGLLLVVIIIYGLAIFIPSLAVLVRRLHDINKSGAWFFIAFIPLIGAIWLLILMCMEGTHGSNTYGPDPKG